MKVAVSSGNAAAIPFFRRAVEIDPEFAMAYAMLGLSYSAVGESVLSAESTTRAWQLRDRVSDREKFFIDFTYDRQVTGNLEKAYQTLELWLQTYPRGDGIPSPQSCWGAFPPTGPADLKERSRHPKRKSRIDPDLSIRVWQSCVQPISSWTVSTKPRARFNEPPNASWRILLS